MSPEALVDYVENVTAVYRSDRFPGVCIRSAQKIDDPQLIALSEEKIPCDYFNIEVGRQQSYLAVSQLQYNRSETKVVVLEHHPDEIIGMLNIGWKYCYIDGKPDLIRYISDLKIHPKFRNKHLVYFLMAYLKETLSRNSIVQSVVLNKYADLQNMLYQDRKNFPAAFHYDNLNIYTVGHVLKPAEFDEFHFEVLSQTQLAGVNSFVNSLKSSYNFLPHYDFNQLVDQNNPFWQGMQLSDFYVIYNKAKKIIGLYGLWDQFIFKSVSLSAHQKKYHYIRPFYNVWASFSQQMPLPKSGQALPYLMLHSALCQPEHTEVYACMLYHAHRQTQIRKKTAFCMALAENDPRKEALTHAKYWQLTAQHRLHSFYMNPLASFDRGKISYFELGRL